MGCVKWVNKLSQRLINRHWPMAARACQDCKLHGPDVLRARSRTWSFDRCLGRFSTSILRSPTPMAPDETIMTLCPSFLNFTAVSTMDVRIERRGAWVFSSTMELVPGNMSVPLVLYIVL